MSFTASMQVPSFRKKKKRKRKGAAPGGAGSSLSMFSSSSTSSSTPAPPATMIHAKPSLASLASAREQHAAALALDPTIFDFDASVQSNDGQSAGGSGAADTMLVSGARATENVDSGSGSRFIGTMLKHASKRKVDQERAYNRMQRRKADEEAAEYGNTEKFVTPAYKAQMLQEAQAEELEREIEAREMDGTAFGGAGSFLANVIQGGSNTSSSSTTTTISSSSSSSSGSSANANGVTALPAASVPHTMAGSASFSSSSSLTSSSLASDSLQPSPEEVALALHRSKLQEDRIKTAEKIAAARARYLLRKAQRAPSA